MATDKTEATSDSQAAAQPTEQPASAQVPQQDPMALSIGDLKNLAVIIDVASSRGSFKAAEMANVGTLYNKLTAFLAKVAPADGKPAEAPMSAPATAGQTQEK